MKLDRAYHAVVSGCYIGTLASVRPVGKVTLLLGSCGCRRGTPVINRACPERAFRAVKVVFLVSAVRFRLLSLPGRFLLSYTLTLLTVTFLIGLAKSFTQETVLELDILAQLALFKQLRFQGRMLGHKDGHLLCKFFLTRHEVLQDKLHRLLCQLVFPVLIGQVLDETVFLIVCHNFLLYILTPFLENVVRDLVLQAK